MKHKQLVTVTFRNNCSTLYNIESDFPITLERVVEYLENEDGFDPDEDTLEFVDEPSPLNIDDAPMSIYP